MINLTDMIYAPLSKGSLFFLRALVLHHQDEAIVV